MIRIEQLRFAYDGGPDVLRLGLFVLEPQSNVLVVGPSGCGKTTLLHLIAGLLLATPIMVAIKAAADHIDPLQPLGELLGT